MDIERLMESVRSRKILYVTTFKSYKNLTKKEEPWRHVADEVGEGVTGRIQALCLLDTGTTRKVFCLYESVL